MIAAQVAKKYAHALFLSTRERGLVEQAYDQFTDLKGLLHRDPEFIRFLGSPKIEEDNKVRVIRSVFRDRLEPLFIEFLVVLVDKRRAGYVIEVIDEFERLVEFEHGIARVTVITAVPLNSQEVTALTAKLAAKTGKKVELEQKVEPEIIGGVIAIMHDRIVDGSVRRGLDLLEEQLQHVKVH
jgi:F-type H+-transporting ATPase subunit delta